MYFCSTLSVFVTYGRHSRAQSLSNGFHTTKRKINPLCDVVEFTRYTLSREYKTKPITSFPICPANYTNVKLATAFNVASCEFSQIGVGNCSIDAQTRKKSKEMRKHFYKYKHIAIRSLKHVKCYTNVFCGIECAIKYR